MHLLLLYALLLLNRATSTITSNERLLSRARTPYDAGEAGVQRSVSNAQNVRAGQPGVDLCDLAIAQHRIRHGMVTAQFWQFADTPTSDRAWLSLSQRMQRNRSMSLILCLLFLTHPQNYLPKQKLTKPRLAGDNVARLRQHRLRAAASDGNQRSLAALQKHTRISPAFLKVDNRKASSAAILAVQFDQGQPEAATACLDKLLQSQALPGTALARQQESRGEESVGTGSLYLRRRCRHTLKPK